jgi:hypothetical protein
MALNICPKCHAKVAKSDTVCMDCGANLIEVRQDIVEQAKKEARGGPTQPASAAAATAASAAAAGMVLPGESAEEKRLRVFDKQEADKLRKQRPAQAVLVLIALIGAGVCAALGSDYLKKAAEAGGLKSLNVAEFKQLGFGIFDDPRVIAIMAVGLAVAGFLCFIGEIRRLLDTNSAIKLVEVGATPNVVHLSAFTQIGLLLLAFFAWPVGLIAGILFKFSKDADTKAIGGLMIYASLLAVGIMLVNGVWGMAAKAIPTQGAPAKGEGGALLVLRRWV